METLGQSTPISRNTYRQTSANDSVARPTNSRTVGAEPDLPCQPEGKPAAARPARLPLRYVPRHSTARCRAWRSPDPLCRFGLQRGARGGAGDDEQRRALGPAELIIRYVGC